MRKLRLVALVALVTLFASACTAATTSGLPASAAATVDGTEIANELLERIIEAQQENPSAGLTGLEGEELANATAELERNILTALIYFELTRLGLEQRDVEVTQEQLDEEYDNQIALAGSEEALLEQIAGVGLTVEEWRDLLMGNVVRENALREAVLAEQPVTEEQLRSVYDQREEAGQYDLGTVSHILKTPEANADGEVTDEARDAATAECEDLLVQLDEGADFAELATENSDDPGSAANGGSLGEAPLSRYVPEFAEAAADAPIGEVVGPVESQFGCHLILVEDRRTQEFEDVEQALRDELIGQQGEVAFQSVVAALVSETEIEVSSRYGMWDPETGEVVSDLPLDS